MRPALRTLALVAALCPGMCAAAAAQGTAPVTIEKGDDSTAARTVPVNARVEVVLPVQLGTGYSWNLVSPENFKAVASLVRVEVGELEDALPGGSERQKFVLATKAAGDLKLEFRLARAPYTMDPADSYVLNLTVR